MPFEDAPFRLGPVLKIVAVLMAAFAVEPVGQLLNFFSHLCLVRPLRRGLVAVRLLLVFVCHLILLCEMTPSLRGGSMKL